MIRFRFIVFLGVLLGLLTFSSGMSGVAQAAPQTNCPVMANNKTDKKLFVDYQGKRIYFCCRGCVAQFKKNPEKYLKKMEAEGVATEKAP